MNEKLIELAKLHERMATERAKMLADEQRSKDTEGRVLAAGVTNDDALKDLTSARTIRELVARRLPDVETALRDIEKEISKELRCRVIKFNRAVREAADARQAEVVAALRPFFEGDLRRLGKLVETLQVQIPAVRGIRDLHFEQGFMSPPALDFYAREARRFIEHSTRAAKSLGLTLD